MTKPKVSTFERLRSKRLNRKERKELQRKIETDDPGLEIVHPHAAGIDIGNESHFAAVGPGRSEQPVQEFGSWTEDLHRMAAWLKSCGVTTVAMQSTGVYWIAAEHVLQQAGLEVYLVNARGTKNLPGRKTDVQECQWIRKLHTYGLLRNSFRPPEQIRAVRTVWRQRDRVVKEAGRTMQQMQKALTTMNVQLANVISDLSGLTGMAILRRILAGERDPWKLAKLRDRRIQASEEEIARSLEGNWQPDVLFELEQVVEAYDLYQKQISDCDKQLQKYMAALPDREAPGNQAASTAAADTPARKAKPRKKQKNQPAFDIEAEQRRTMGVDLRKVDGIDIVTTQTVLSELGPDLSAWRTEDHFTSWLQLAPRRDISGGKVIRQPAQAVRNRVANAFRNAAQALSRSDSYLGAKYRYLHARLGGLKGTKAMARYLACLVYRMLTKGEAWVDRGSAYYENKRRERELVAVRRKAAALGMQVVPAC